jgi:hypothetical protein
MATSHDGDDRDLLAEKPESSFHEEVSIMEREGAPLLDLLGLLVIVWLRRIPLIKLSSLDVHRLVVILREGGGKRVGWRRN